MGNGETTRAVPDRVPTGLLLAAALAKFIVGAFALSLSPLLVDVGRSLGVGAERLGLAGAAYGAASLAMAFFGAPLQDRFQRPTLIWVGLALHVAGLLASALAPTWQILVVGHLICGIGAGLLLPALVALLSDLTPFERRAATLSRTNVGWAASTLLGVPMAGILGHLDSWRAPAFAFVALWFIAAVLMIRALTRSGIARSGPKSGVVDHSSSAEGLAQMTPMFVVTLLAFIGFYGVYPYLGSTLRQEMQLDSAGAGAFVACYGLGFLSATFMGKAVDEFGKARSLLVSLVGLAIILAWIPTAIELGRFAVGTGMLAWGILQNISFTSGTALVSNISPAIRGRALALNQAALSAGVMVGSGVMGPVYAGHGLKMPATWCAGSTAIAALVVFFRVLPASGTARRFKGAA